MGKQPDAGTRLTKTRLRRGEIAREKREPPCAEIIDFLPAVHGDVEDILCDVSADERNDKLPPDPDTAPE